MMRRLNWFALAASVLTLTACGPKNAGNAGDPGPDSPRPKARVVALSEVVFDKLNPARGDQSPKAGTVWGDRNGKAATGFLFRPVDGFRSPPHIHNVSYRGVVIRGVVHNDHPDAKEQWMPAGSFWTQPKGAVHITAAKGTDTLAYIEIDEGPYLVWPVDRAFDSGEKAVNVDASDIPWSPRKTSGAAAGIEESLLWSDTKAGHLNGRLLRLPAGFTGSIQNAGKELRAVVIQGSVLHGLRGTATRTLPPGSYFSSHDDTVHSLSCREPSVLYVRTRGEPTVKQS